MKTIIIFITTILFQQCAGQSGTLPECIEKLTSEKKYKYESILQLPNGEKVYKIKIIRPEKCMDCPSGVIYKDSLCTTIANFTVSRAPQNFVKEGYEKSWFIQDKNTEKKESNLSEAQHSAEDSKAYFEQFTKSGKYKVKKINKNSNPLDLIKNDIIQISLENGLVVYRKSKTQNQYKVIPETADFFLKVNCVKAPCPKIKKTKDYLRWDNWGIDFNQDNEIMIYNFNKFPENQNSGWEKIYEIEKLP